METNHQIRAGKERPNQGGRRKTKLRLETNSGIKVGKEGPNQGWKRPAGPSNPASLWAEGSPTSSPDTNSPNQSTAPPRGRGTLPGRLRPFPERFSPLENEKAAQGGRAQPGPCRGAQGGLPSAPCHAEAEGAGPGHACPGDGVYVQGQEPPPAPAPGLGRLLGKESQFWMHRGFIPALPHCIGKCNSLAWELGDDSLWR